MPYSHVPPLAQVGMIVPDLEEALRQYSGLLDVGPWEIFTFEPPKLYNTVVHGVKQAFSMKVAIHDSKSMMLELIQPLKGHSIYNDFLEERGGKGGIHHLASLVTGDVNKHLEYFRKKGVQLIQSGEYSVGKFHSAFFMLDTEKTLGTVLELLKLDGKPPPAEETYP
jgi:methylmalonyl-CoA/ethylmalonyl-CoA epimerase